MNRYNPNDGHIWNLPQHNCHKRKSIRLKGYDYSQAGLYFITICIKNRECLFGNIKNGKMILNDACKMVEKWYYELENKYPDIKCNEIIVMPNHTHFIIHNVGADLRVCPDNKPLHSYYRANAFVLQGEHTGSLQGEHTGSPLHRFAPTTGGAMV